MKKEQMRQRQQAQTFCRKSINPIAQASCDNMRKPAPHRRNGTERYSIAMVAACAFPANHGSPASVREMSDTLSQMGHAVHIVTYSTGQNDIVVRGAKVHRTGPFRPETNAKV